MKEEVSNCGRENDLIGFLYGELNDVEARAFQRHVRECPACNAELATFSEVRESVVAWRNESLGGLVSPTLLTNSAIMETGKDKSSALAALREFFNLSPLWLKSAVAFASILFCLFAGLTIARLRDKPPILVVTPAPSHQSQQEINALVEQRVQDELRRINNSKTEQPESSLTAHDSSQKKFGKRIANRNNELAGNNQKARRPLSKTEREQLAADLRLTSGKNDSELDLLDDRINQ